MSLKYFRYPTLYFSTFIYLFYSQTFCPFHLKHITLSLITHVLIFFANYCYLGRNRQYTIRSDYLFIYLFFAFDIGSTRTHIFTENNKWHTLISYRFFFFTLLYYMVYEKYIVKSHQRVENLQRSGLDLNKIVRRRDL